MVERKWAIWIVLVFARTCSLVEEVSIASRSCYKKLCELCEDMHLLKVHTFPSSINVLLNKKLATVGTDASKGKVFC